MQRIFMENDRDFRVLTPKFKSFDGVISPINVMNFAGSRRHISKFDPYASDGSDSPSPLMKYLRSADAGSPTAFRTPVKVEEDVIVMDGIPVPKSKKGSGEVRTRSPLMPFNSNIGSFGRSNSTPPSSGSGGKGSGSDNSKIYRNKLCRFWECSGICQFGSECQFAHGKEELRHHRPSRIKPEIFKLNYNLEGSSSSSYGSKSPQITRVKGKAASPEEAFSSPPLPIPPEMGFPTSPIQIKQPSGSPNSSGPSTNTTLLKSDWTPEIDGIKVTLPLDSTDFDAYVKKVLYSTNARKRLPVFVEICPDC